MLNREAAYRGGQRELPGRSLAATVHLSAARRRVRLGRLCRPLVDARRLRVELLKRVGLAGAESPASVLAERSVKRRFSEQFACCEVVVLSGEARRCLEVRLFGRRHPSQR
jgi:hypothetical protein